MSDHVYDKDYANALYVEKTEEGLDVIATDDTTEVTVSLNATGVRKLRLLLQRYERTQK